jgi:hypothetical protein
LDLVGKKKGVGKFLTGLSLGSVHFMEKDIGKRSFAKIASKRKSIKSCMVI